MKNVGLIIVLVVVVIIVAILINFGITKKSEAKVTGAINDGIGSGALVPKSGAVVPTFKWVGITQGDFGKLVPKSGNKVPTYKWNG
jgi:hypothetical protein